MTRQEVFKILNAVNNLDADLQIVRIQIERMESTLQGHAIRYDIDKVQTSPSDKVADVIADMEKLLDKRDRLQHEIIAAMDESAALIARLTDNKHRLVLHYRYTAGLPWAQVAAHVGYDERHTRRLRDEAVDILVKSKDVRKCP
jgi:DNA-directed RNA polymerase specialized sigma subunit